MGANTSALLDEEEKNNIQEKCLRYGVKVEDVENEAAPMFAKLDSNSDGFLDQVEFGQCLNFLGQKDEGLVFIFFRALDRHDRGKISLYQFVDWWLDLVYGSADDKIKWGFRYIDHDGDGVISKGEMVTTIKTFYKVLTRLKVTDHKVEREMEVVDKYVSNVFELAGVGTGGSLCLDDYRDLALRNPAVLQGLNIVQTRAAVPIGRSGRSVFFGTDRWSQVLSIMLGMRLTSDGVTRHYNLTTPEALDRMELTDEAYKFKMDISIPSEDGREAIFTSYAPLAFRKIKRAFGILEDSFMLSIGFVQLLGNLLMGDLSSLSGQMSEGKSGSFFYFTRDGRFLIKTISPDEKHTLQELLPDYYEHVKANPNTFLPRLVGLFKLNLGKKPSNICRLVVMCNVFNTNKQIHERYDLKGSQVGRTVGRENQGKEGLVFKDLDFLEMKGCVELSADTKDRIMTQMRRDVDFLRDHCIIDYSLLLGVHYKNRRDKGQENAWIAHNSASLHQLFETLQITSKEMTRRDTSGRDPKFFDRLRYEDFCRMAAAHSTIGEENDSDGDAGWAEAKAYEDNELEKAAREGRKPSFVYAGAGAGAGASAAAGEGGGLLSSSTLPSITEHGSGSSLCDNPTATSSTPELERSLERIRRQSIGSKSDHSNHSDNTCNAVLELRRTPSSGLESSSLSSGDNLSDRLSDGEADIPDNVSTSSHRSRASSLGQDFTAADSASPVPLSTHAHTEPVNRGSSRSPICASGGPSHSNPNSPNELGPKLVSQTSGASSSSSHHSHGSRAGNFFKGLASTLSRSSHGGRDGSSSTSPHALSRAISRRAKGVAKESPSRDTTSDSKDSVGLLGAMSVSAPALTEVGPTSDNDNNMPARSLIRRSSVRRVDSSKGLHSLVNDAHDHGEIYYVGIIDTLIEYRLTKKTENTLKSVIYDGNKISVVPPPLYAERFLSFMEQVFK